MSTSTSTNHHPYTCLGCALAFTDAQTQRAHYATDLHRYNSKRNLAGLTPVDLETFNLKFNNNNSNSSTTNNYLDSNHHQAFRCQTCDKSFGSKNAHINHLASKKHIKAVQQISHSNQETTTKKIASPQPTSSSDPNRQSINDRRPMDLEPKEGDRSNKKIELEQLIKLRIQQAPQIESNECLFCPRSSSLKFADVDEALKHMLHSHGFFLPDQEYLVDKTGLLSYLAEMIAVWNVCLYCGTGFGGKIQADHSVQDHALLTRKGLESVRKHMCDKNHCKFAWDTEKERLEFSDFFDYRSSYKTVKKDTNKSKAARILSIVEDDEWEDESDMSSDGIERMKTDDDDEDEELNPDERLASMGDSPFELVLPDGIRLGHRSLRYIYKQNLLPYSVGSQSTQAGNRNINLITRLAVLSGHSTQSLKDQEASKALVRRITKGTSASKASSLTDAGLIPSRGGGLNFNQPGHQLVIKARNPGEAKEAGKHIRTFKDVHRRQQFQNRVACTSGNNQKHYRDPLLQ